MTTLQAAASAAEKAKQAGAKAKAMLEAPAHEAMAKTSAEAQVKADPEARHNLAGGDRIATGLRQHTDGLHVHDFVDKLHREGYQHITVAIHGLSKRRMRSRTLNSLHSADAD